MTTAKTILSEYRLLDEFQGSSSVLGDSTLKIHGHVEGFIFTTAYIPSKGVSLSKKDVIDLWKQLKTNKKLWRLFENHRNDLPPIGYIHKAQLYEKGNWCGVYTITAVTSRQALQKIEKGLLGGFSIATRYKNNAKTNQTIKRTASLDIEAKAYSSEQISKIRNGFPPEYKVVVSEVYRFSELPPLIINLAINIDVQNIVAVIIQKPVETTVLVSAGIILKKGLELVIEDVYKFLKKTAKHLFDNKEKRNPVVITRTNLLDKEIVIRNTPSSPSELVKNTEKIMVVLSKLSKNELLKIAKAKKVVIKAQKGKVQVSSEN